MGKEYTITKIIHLKHLVRYLFKKWKVEVIITIAVALIVGIVGIIKINNDIRTVNEQPDIVEKKIEVSEKAFNRIKIVYDYEELMDAQQKYNDESIAMHINPSEREGYKINYIFNGVSDEMKSALRTRYAELIDVQQLYKYITQCTGEEIDSSYYGEVFMFENETDINGIYVKFYHWNPQILEQVCNAVSDYLDNIKQQINSEGISHDLVAGKEKLMEADMSLGSYQKTNVDNLIVFTDTYTARYDDLSSNQKKYLELYKTAKNSPEYTEGEPLYTQITVDKSGNVFKLTRLLKYLMAGVVLGIILGAGVVTMYYIYSPKLLNENNLEDMFHIHLLSCCRKVMNEEEAQKIVLVIEQLLFRHLSNGNQMLVLSSSDNLKEHELYLSLQDKFNKQGKCITFVCINNNEEYLAEKINGADFVIFFEEEGVSKLGDIAKKIDICGICGKSVAGAVVFG